MGDADGAGGRWTIVAVVVACVLAVALVVGLWAVDKLFKGEDIHPVPTSDTLTGQFGEEGRASYPDLDWGYRTDGEDGGVTAVVRGEIGDPGMARGLVELLRRQETEASYAGKDFEAYVAGTVGEVEFSFPYGIPGEALERLHGFAASGTWRAITVDSMTAGPGLVLVGQSCAPTDGRCFDALADGAAEAAAVLEPGASGWTGEVPSVRVRFGLDAPLDGPGRELSAVAAHGIADESGPDQVRLAMGLLRDVSAAGAASATGAGGDADVTPESIIVGEDGGITAKLAIRESSEDPLPDDAKIAVLGTVVDLLRDGGARPGRDAGAPGPGPVIDVEMLYRRVVTDAFTVDADACAADGESESSGSQGSSGSGTPQRARGDDREYALNGDGGPSPVELAVREMLGCPVPG